MIIIIDSYKKIDYFFVSIKKKKFTNSQLSLNSPFKIISHPPNKVVKIIIKKKKKKKKIAFNQ